MQNTAGHSLALAKEDPLSKTLKEIGKEEELCEQLLSIIQGEQSKSKGLSFYRRAPEMPEELARLHIEEEPNLDHLESPVANKRQPMITFEGNSSADTKKEVFKHCTIMFYCTYIISPDFVQCICFGMKLSTTHCNFQEQFKHTNIQLFLLQLFLKMS